MSIISAATVTLAGVDYDPVLLRLSADNNWAPTFKAECTLPREGMVQSVAAARNLITNPSASVDLTDAVASSATLARQSAITVFASAHRTAYRVTATAVASQVTIGGDYGGLRLGMLAGHTYTLSGTYYQDTVSSGTENAQSRQLAVGVINPSSNGGNPYYLATSPKAPNTATTATRLSVTFTLPADATSAVVRAFVGHSSAVGYWTDLMLVEGNGTDPDGAPMAFFDGDNAPNALYKYVWLGAAGKSASERQLAASNGMGPVVDPRLYPPARLRWWWGEDGGTGTPPLMYDVTLLVRLYAINDAEGTVQLTLLSDEIRLQDIKNVDTGDYAPGAMTLQAMVAFVMRRLGNPTVDMTGIPATVIPATATIWKAGDSLDNWIQGPMRSAGLELYYDAFTATWRAWSLTTAGKSADTAILDSIAWSGNLLSGTVGIDADSPDYGDAVTMLYTWTDAAGASQRKAYASTPPGPYRKGLTRTFTSPDPGVDPAPATRALTTRSGYTARAVSLPVRSTLPGGGGVTRPAHLGDSALLFLSDGTIYSGAAANITWEYPADQMTTGLSNIVFNGALAPS